MLFVFRRLTKLLETYTITFLSADCVPPNLDVVFENRKVSSSIKDQKKAKNVYNERRSAAEHRTRFDNKAA